MKNWKLFSLLLMLLFGGIMLLDGCYPNDSISVDQSDIVLTGRYDSVDFQTLKTYYMPDTVFPVREDTTDKSPVPNQDFILQTIESNMSAYGYQRVYYDENAQNPDVMLAVSGILVTTVSVGWWYPYYPGWGWGWGWYKKGDASRDLDYWYGGWWGYYPPGWGWGSVPYYSSYTTGTLLIEMSNPEDFRVIDGDTVVPIYWAAGLNGVASGGSDQSRIGNGIDQAFLQSSYLKLN
ncbi:MAG: DUF4136 domain-containing protein [bacterium]